MHKRSRNVPDQPLHRGGIRWKQLDWTIITGLVVMHAVAALAVMPSLFTWSGLAILLVLSWVSSCLGITLCYHRLLCHRSFRTPKWFEYFLTMCGCLAWQGGPIQWVGTHRLHHQHSDDDHDPHSPQHGFTWAHILWFLHVSHEGVHRRQAATDLAKDPVIRLIDRYAYVPPVILAILLLVAGWVCFDALTGLSWMVWGSALRTVAFFHFTWFVNSAGHTWGYQNYNTGEHSTNLWWLALLSFGEGWHNNHHAHPRSAAHGLRWFEVDPTYWTIKALSLVGLASKIHKIAPHQMPGRA